MSSSTDPSVSTTRAPALRGWLDAFGRTVTAGVARLGRPVRPNAAPGLRLFDNWAERFSAALIGLALVLAGMAYVDRSCRACGAPSWGRRRPFGKW